MAKDKDIKIVKSFKEKLSKDIKVNKLIFFGSRSSGKYKRWSDFDLIIVSPYFKNKKPRYRSLGFREYWNNNYPVDFLCYTPREFNRLKKQVSLVAQATKEGIEI